MKAKRIIKIILGAIVFLTLPSIIFFGFIYFKYNEDLPTGKESIQADSMAINMLESLNYKAYKATNYIEWTFKNRHHYKWQKNKNKCQVYWKNYQVNLILDGLPSSKAFVDDLEVTGEQAEKLIEKAQNYFNNDSFWLVAPYKVFDNGVERRLVTQDNGMDALLVTYTSGGSTPGDTYLWILDNNNKPIKFKMWVDIIPIGGLEASWTDWTTTESGAMLPTFHEMLFLGIELKDVKGTR